FDHVACDEVRSNLVCFDIDLRGFITLLPRCDSRGSAYCQNVTLHCTYSNCQEIMKRRKRER
ncbi:hypothetical protein KUCAC02_011369, partial [Chaenocephalus aceratus]